ncbi:KTSC domain-containing protein [Xylophilus sp. GOD-11R]|uniref:KTSC domain-containing protein n=1 Tax=Xylophilus sp. GOD-11R TaxID=3089814 RepID=UPI00298BD16E|nr:KTSC domain-containing protein [Xylophilus sp. GOD-11R]WPB58604.1 KTSC domain-containing protein [Xylophilus sp. GOD-11R]
MPKTFPIAQPFSEGEPLAINRQAVESNQVAEIGYDPETKTLAVTFTRGQALYQYPNVEPETHAAFLAAESIGKFFGEHIKALPFKKFKLPEVAVAGGRP